MRALAAAALAISALAACDSGNDGGASQQQRALAGQGGYGYGGGGQWGGREGAVGMYQGAPGQKMGGQWGRPPMRGAPEGWGPAARSPWGAMGAAPKISCEHMDEVQELLRKVEEKLPALETEELAIGGAGEEGNGKVAQKLHHLTEEVKKLDKKADDHPEVKEKLSKLKEELKKLEEKLSASHAPKEKKKERSHAPKREKKDEDPKLAELYKSVKELRHRLAEFRTEHAVAPALMQPGTEHIEVAGRVTSISPEQLRLKDDHGYIYTFELPGKTEVRHKGDPYPLAKIDEGAEVRASATIEGDRPYVTHIEVKKTVEEKKKEATHSKEER